MATTVQQIRDDLAIMKRDISDVPNATFILWCDWINQFAYRFMISIDPERWISTQNYTVTSAPQTEALPSDFKSIQEWETGFYYLDDEGNNTERRLTRTGFGRTQPGYYIKGTNVIFTGIDQSTTFTLRYIPALAALTALTDTVVIPDEFNNYMVKAVAVMYEQWDEQPGAESLADLRFARALNELSRNLRKEPHAYGMDDFSGTF